MKKSPKRLDRLSFRKRAIPLVLGLLVLSILRVSGAPQLVSGIPAMTLAEIVLVVFLAMALARRFRDIGWPAWMGPTALLVIIIGLPILNGYAAATLNVALKWAPTVGLISDYLSLVLVIDVGFVPGKPELADVFD